MCFYIFIYIYIYKLNKMNSTDNWRFPCSLFFHWNLTFVCPPCDLPWPRLQICFSPTLLGVSHL